MTQHSNEPALRMQIASLEATIERCELRITELRDDKRHDVLGWALKPMIDQFVTAALSGTVGDPATVIPEMVKAAQQIADLVYPPPIAAARKKAAP